VNRRAAFFPRVAIVAATRVDAAVDKVAPMLRRYLASFHPRQQPAMTRQSYAHELASVMSFPVAVSLIEGTVIGVLAKKAFDVPNLALAVILASPMFAMVTSFVWARLARGRSKVGFLVVLMGAVLVCVAAIALLPRSLVGAWSLAGLMVVTRCLLAGMVTIRSVIWRNNYPRLVRASVAGRLTVVQNLIMAGCPAIGYAFLDVAPWSFRILYPLAAVLGAFGVIAMSRVRMRQGRRLLRCEPTSNGA